MVVQADSTLAAIRKKVRRLTASSSESTLTTDDIDQYINTFYSQDFAYAIKLDQMRSVYTFYTSPYQDRYPLDVNFNQGIRSPVYVDGILGAFFKDREQFYNMWPRWPTRFQPAFGDGSTVSFTFTIGGGTPFLPNQVTIGSIAVDGSTIQIADDGQGNLNLLVPNAQTTVPTAVTNVYPTLPPVPGMLNRNNANPGLNGLYNVGTVDYVTGLFTITNLPEAPAAGEALTVFVSQYQPGKPYSVLFWNNELTIRPIPKLVHKIELETYMTPVQFMQTTDNPILNQWWQYIAIGAAIKVLEDRQDMEGVANLATLFDRQEGLILERQGVEEIGQRNTTIFSSSVQTPGWNQPYGGGWY